MAAAKMPPLDELVWQSADAAGFIGQGYGVHNNNVLYYFAESPFFDRTSNNQIVRTQAEMPGRERMIATRAAFEDELRKRSGLEFMVASSQIDHGHADVAGSMGRWVINKQRRTKTAGAPDTVEVLATYFVLGDLVYMAPSLGNIFWSRLTALTDSMNSLVTTASSLPTFTPAIGYTYIDPSLRSSTSKPLSASSVPSRLGTPVPGDDVVMANSQDPPSSAGAEPAKSQSSVADAQTLMESFAIFQRHRNEYMDEVPLLGEPGSFSFANRARPPPISTSSNSAVASKTSSQASKTESNTATQSQSQSQGTQETAKSDDGVAVKKEDKPASAPKIKRRKSKAPHSPTSPTSPSSPTSPLSAAPSPRG